MDGAGEFVEDVRPREGPRFVRRRERAAPFLEDDHGFLGRDLVLVAAAGREAQARTGQLARPSLAAPLQLLEAVDTADAIKRVVQHDVFVWPVSLSCRKC